MKERFHNHKRVGIVIILLGIAIGALFASAGPPKQQPSRKAVTLKMGENIPSKLKNKTREANTQRVFKQIYKRAPNLQNTKDRAIFETMAYRLRPPRQDQIAERAAVKYFGKIFKRLPKSDLDWSIIMAFAYYDRDSLVKQDITPRDTAVVPAFPYSANGCASPFSDLIAWFPAEQNGRNLVNKRHGAVPARVTFAAGHARQAFSFPQNNSPSVQVIDPAANPARYEFDITGPFTVEAWVKFLQEPGLTDALIMSKGNAFKLTLGDGLDLRAKAASGTQVITTFYGLTAPTQGANEWVHVAATFDGQILRAYRNGEVEEYAAFLGDTTLESNELPLKIGGGPYSPSASYLLDEVRVYNRALTESEINAIRENGSEAQCVLQDSLITACETSPSGMIAWWPGENATESIIGETFLDGALQPSGDYGEGLVGRALAKTAPPGDGLRVADNGISGYPLDLREFSIEGWIRPDVFRGSAIAKGDNYSILLPGDGRVQFGFFEGGAIQRSVSTPWPMFSGSQWTHVAGTFDGHRMNLYVNGALANTNLINASALIMPQINNSPLCLGCENFTGLIDEFTVYNRALDYREIDRIYRAGNYGKCRPVL